MVSATKSGANRFELSERDGWRHRLGPRRAQSNPPAKAREEGSNVLEALVALGNELRAPRVDSETRGTILARWRAAHAHMSLAVAALDARERMSKASVLHKVTWPAMRKVKKY